jgi:hypothetical protein
MPKQRSNTRLWRPLSRPSSACASFQRLSESLENDFLLNSLPPENDVTGQICEASQDNVVNRDWIPYRASSPMPFNLAKDPRLLAVNQETKELWNDTWFPEPLRNYEHGAKVQG